MHAPSFVYGAIVLSATAVSALALPADTLAKRHPVGVDGTCAPQPLGYGPSPSVDTADAFQSYPGFASAANGATTPSGYGLAAVNQLATVQQDGAAYITYEEIKSYDVGYCASRCDSFYAGCSSFNIYFERDPTLDSGPTCTNPTSTTRIKCAFFTGCGTNDQLTNKGQYCYDFHVVMAGSNVYNKQSGCGPKPSTTTTTPVATTTASTTAITTASTTASTTAVVTTTKATTTTGWGNWPTTKATTPVTTPVTTKPVTTPSTTAVTTPSTTKPVTTPSTTKATTPSTTPATTPSTTKPVTTPSTTKPVTPTTTPCTTKPTTLITTTKSVPAQTTASTTKSATKTTPCPEGPKSPAPQPWSPQPWNPQPPKPQPWSNQGGWKQW